MIKKTAAFILALLMVILPSGVFASETDITEDDRTDYYRNEGLILTYTLNEDGTVLVNEHWSVYCKGVPGVFSTKIFGHDGIKINDLRVFDDESKAYVRIFGDIDKGMTTGVFTHTENAGDNYTQIDIYHITTDDRFNINISYTIAGAVTNYADAGVFEHTVIDDRLLSENMPEIQVNLITHRDLEKFSDFRLSIYANQDYELKPVNKAETDFYVYDVPVGEAISVKAVLPLELFSKNTLTSDDYILGKQEYTKPDFYYFTPPVWEVFTPSVLFRIDLFTTAENFPGGWAGMILMLISPAFILGGIDLISRKNASSSKTSRPYRSQNKKRYVYAYPDDLSYAEAARLTSLAKMQNVDRPRFFSSIVLSLYSKGYINILATKRNLRITVTGRTDEFNLSGYEKLVLIFMEEALGENDSMGMKELSEYMFYNCDRVRSLSTSAMHLIDEGLIDKGYLDYASNNIIYRRITSSLTKTSAMIYTAVMLIFSAVCNFMFIMGSGRGYLALGLISLFAVCVVAASRIPRRIITLSGEDSASMWNSFARTLNESERLFSEENISAIRGANMLFVYANALGANKRSLRHLNRLIPWIGQDKSADDDYASREEEMYEINVSRLLQFLDDIEKMADNCIKLYNSEKGPFRKIRTKRRIAYFAKNQDPADERDVFTTTEEILSEEGDGNSQQA